MGREAVTLTIARERLRQKAWLVYLVVGAAVGILYYFGPSFTRSGKVFNLVGLSAVIAVLVGTALHRTKDRLAWFIFACGLGLQLAGDIVTYNPQIWFHKSNAPFPCVGDLFYVLVYPVLMTGILVLIRRRSPGRDRAALIDSLIISIGIGVLSWIYFMAPFAHDSSLSILAKLTSIAYPLGDLLLLAAMVRMTVGGGRRPAAFYLLLLSVLALLVTDSIYNSVLIFFQYDGSGSGLDAGWGLFYILWGAAALHPSMRVLGQNVRQESRPVTQRRLWILASASLMAPAVQAVQAVRGRDSDGLIVAAASAVLFVLVLVRLRGLMVDIDEYKRTETLLRETEEKYRSLVEGTPAIVYIAEFPKEGRWRYVSPQVEPILGFSAQQWLDTPGLWQERLHPVDRDRVLREQNRDVEGGQRILFEYRMVARDGEVVWIRDDAEILLDEEGRPTLLQGVMYDFSEQKRAESKLREALDREREASQHLRKLDSMKNSFLQAVSHDLRTPLTSILAGALTLENPQVKLTPEERIDLVQRLAGNARKLNRLLSDLLDLDRLSRGILTPNRKPTDLAELIQRVVAECDLQGHLVEIDAEPIMAEVDAAQIERIVENLVTNAVRYTPPGTPVWVRVAAYDRGALITVEDAGPGVPSELRKSIFEPFRQGQEVVEHSPGVGIGLSLVTRFAALHSGRAWVDDRPGGGASFKVYLPREMPLRVAV
jgi:PAS domain S-box-containing protein